MEAGEGRKAMIGGLDKRLAKLEETSSEPPRALYVWQRQGEPEPLPPDGWRSGDKLYVVRWLPSGSTPSPLAAP